MDTTPHKAILRNAGIRASVANIGYAARVTLATTDVEAALTALTPLFAHGNPATSHCTVCAGKSQIVVR